MNEIIHIPGTKYKFGYSTKMAYLSKAVVFNEYEIYRDIKYIKI